MIYFDLGSKMTSEYSRNVLRVVVAQICQTVGWHSINASPLEYLVDLMHEYILRVSKLTHQYSEVCEYLLVFFAYCKQQSYSNFN